MIRKLREIEDAYLELFSQKKTEGNTSVFRNDDVKEMYSRNFILINEIISEDETKKYITGLLHHLKEQGKDFLKLVFFPEIQLTPGFLTWAEQTGFEISKILYMITSPEERAEPPENPQSDVRRINTAEDIKSALDSVIKFSTERMNLELARKKLRQKESQYLNKSLQFYVCYVDGKPIGFCDWFQKDGIVKLEEFIVLKEYQWKGYGSLMLSRMISDAAREGFTYVYVVTEDDGKAVNLYHKFGFKLVGEETELFWRLPV